MSWGEPPEKATWELYNMEDDKTETQNLAAQHPEIVKELAALYKQWHRRVYAKNRGKG